MTSLVIISALTATVLALIITLVFRNKSQRRLQQQYDNLSAQLREFEIEYAKTEQQLIDHQEHEQRIAELTQARAQLQEQFKITANEVLKSSQAEATAQQQEQLAHIVSPMQEQIRSFREHLQQNHHEQLKDRAGLQRELQLLAERHQELAEGARKLTTALTGNSKARGDWGEITLRRILERSGLREGEEFILQDSQYNDAGQLLRPDVVVQLPEKSALVIDSKLQLISWQEVCDAESDEERAIASSKLVAAIRGHVRELDRKQYAKLYDRAVDLVVMYVPIDAAVLTALAADPGLYDESYDSGVVITGPTMLMALLSSLSHQWRAHRQEANVLKIAKAGEQLVEQIERVFGSLEHLGDRLRQSQDAYDKTLKQLATGRGNLLKRSRDLGELGLKSAQNIGMNWELIDSDIDNPADSESADNPTNSRGDQDP